MSSADRVKNVYKTYLNELLFKGFDCTYRYRALFKILSTYLYKLFSGSLIVSIITLIPFAIFLALIGLEIVVSLIQAFVFTLLVCSYLKDAIELH